MNFGVNLKSFRTKFKFSQEELAFRLGVTRQSVSKWEVGTAYPEMTNIVALCTLFNCKITDLIDEGNSDFNKFDDEVKNEVVVFKNKEQKGISIISKIIYVATMIFSLAMFVSIIISLISIVTLPFIQNNIIIDGDVIKIFNNNVDIDRLIISNINITNNNVFGILEYQFIIKLLQNIITFITTYSLYKLFKNINKEKIPFTNTNEKYIKIIVINMILSGFILNVISYIYSLITNTKTLVITDFELISILIALAVVYLFKYGRLIQKDSNKVMKENK